VSEGRPHIFIDATSQEVPEPCRDCGGRDYTCGRCGTYFVPYHDGELKKLRLRVVELESRLADAWNMREQANREARYAYRDAVSIKVLQDLPSEWRSMLSLTVEDVARELETILERWRERSEQAKVAREVRDEAAGDGSAPQRPV
jgi:gas vesicle protein